MVKLDNSWCVYVLKCRNNYLYIGITNNLERRLKEHEQGTGSKFVRTWRPFELVKVISCNDGKEARRLEYRLKRFKRNKKMEILGINLISIERKFSKVDFSDIKGINTILNRGVDAKIW